MTSDLALLADRRAGLSALLGLLLLEEPGPGLLDLVAGVPALAALATGDPGIAVVYERVFLRGVPLYESVFRNVDGQQGGATLARVVEHYDRVGFTEHLENRWRIAGADHLGLELRCYAQLCHDEAAAWHSDIPDAAMAAVETERGFLAAHVSAWAQVALDAALLEAGDSPYHPLVEAIVEFLHDEHRRLRPGPMVGHAVEVAALPDNLGPARLARLLLAPATSGMWLSSTVIAAATGAIGAPWRPSDARSALRLAVESAEGGGDLRVLLTPIAEAVRVAAVSHAGRAVLEPANEANWRRWQTSAETMADLLDSVIDRGALRTTAPRSSETITISGADPATLAEAVDAVIAQLHQQGFEVSTSSATPTVRLSDVALQ